MTICTRYKEAEPSIHLLTAPGDTATRSKTSNIMGILVVEGRVSKKVQWIVAIALLSLVGWTHAVIYRMKKKNPAYNKYVFSTAVILYMTCNFIQSHSFPYKTWFSLAFIIYSLVAIPFHVWLMISWTKEKKSASH